MIAAENMLVPVEVRSVDEAQRCAVMLVCRYGETSTRTARPERFAPGAFTRSVSDRGDKIPFTDRHTGGTGELRAPAVARPVSWDTSGDAELLAVLRFYDTPEGWGLYGRARDGEIDAGSVGFRRSPNGPSGGSGRSLRRRCITSRCWRGRKRRPPMTARVCSRCGPPARRRCSR